MLSDAETRLYMVAQGRSFRNRRRTSNLKCIFYPKRKTKSKRELAKSEPNVLDGLMKEKMSRGTFVVTGVTLNSSIQSLPNPNLHPS